MWLELPVSRINRETNENSKCRAAIVGIGTDPAHAIAGAKVAGFRAIICNRPDGERSDPPSFADIVRAARTLGIDAHYLPAEPGKAQMSKASHWASCSPIFPSPCSRIATQRYALDDDVGAVTIAATAVVTDRRCRLVRSDAAIRDGHQGENTTTEKIIMKKSLLLATGSMTLPITLSTAAQGGRWRSPRSRPFRPDRKASPYGKGSCC